MVRWVSRQFLTDEKLELPLADLEDYGLSLREINGLDEAGAIWVGEAAGMRLEKILDALGHKGTLELVNALNNLSRGHKPRPELEDGDVV